MINPGARARDPSRASGDAADPGSERDRGAALTGEADPEAAAKVLAGRSNAPVVVTLGQRGAIVVADARVDTIAAPRVDAVDTTGAGDTFVGALAAELSIGRPMIEAVRFAVYAASLSVRVAGAREGMPTRGEVEKLMQQEAQ